MEMHETCAEEAYANLRRGGASAGRATTELGLPPGKARVLDASFQAKPPGRGADAMRPRFAAHDVHVAGWQLRGARARRSKRRQHWPERARADLRRVRGGAGKVAGSPPWGMRRKGRPAAAGGVACRGGVSSEMLPLGSL